MGGGVLLGKDMVGNTTERQYKKFQGLERAEVCWQAGWWYRWGEGGWVAHHTVFTACLALVWYIV